MTWLSLLPFLNHILNEVEPGTRKSSPWVSRRLKSDFFFNIAVSDATLSKLHFICPEKLILAALDIVDRGNVIHYVAPWGHEEYQVLGSSGSYSVLADLTDSVTVPFTCTCPAFVYSVLLAQSHLLCKHTLATLIARRLQQCVERQSSLSDLEEYFKQQFPVEQGSPGVGDVIEFVHSHHDVKHQMTPANDT